MSGSRRELHHGPCWRPFVGYMPCRCPRAIGFCSHTFLQRCQEGCHWESAALLFQAWTVAQESTLARFEDPLKPSFTSVSVRARLHYCWWYKACMTQYILYYHDSYGCCIWSHAGLFVISSIFCKACDFAIGQGESGVLVKGRTGQGAVQ